MRILFSYLIGYIFGLVYILMIEKKIILAPMFAVAFIIGLPFAPRNTFDDLMIFL